MGRKPVRSIPGCPIPEAQNEIMAALADYWPVWELQERLEKDGIDIDRAVFRRGWVKLHINWYRAEREWKTPLNAEIIRDIVAMCANEEELYFNHWQVVRPAHLDISSAWTETLATEARQAVVFFRTTKAHGRPVGELLQYLKREEVNSIILASAFSLMEKEGKDDQD